MGAAAGGWWRDPQAAVRRLADRLTCHQARTGGRIVLVLDVPHPDLPEDGDPLEVHYPRRQGRDAADERIIELLDEAGGDEPTVVVTSDRALAEAARRRGVEVTGAGAFLADLDRTGC